MAVDMDVNKLADQLKEVLEPLAEKLGQGAEVIYKMAVKDSWITGIQSAVELVALTIVAFFFAKYMIKWAKYIVAEPVDDIVWLPYGLLAVGGCLFTLLVIPYLFESAVHYCMNPEYMALKDLLHSIK